ncbi:MAG TPA: CoA-binding protein [Anaerolineaceae bacterium]|jgi:predicted CoA-binding protein|nr:CoA-binding protein [Anaerolineaceae bacterium]
MSSSTLPGASPDDNFIRQILENTRTIAVVGISDEVGRPSHRVSAYLKRKGYIIIPVNPTIPWVLGEKSYPDILHIPDRVDVVLLFRRSEMVMPHVKEAIQIGAKVVWMQEGIVNETAAELARSAGLSVVMDTCMLVKHRELANRGSLHPDQDSS